MVAKRKKLTKKQIKYFGTKAQKAALKRGKSKVKATKKSSTKKKTTKKKTTGTTGVIANNAILNDLLIGAGAAALGYGVKTFQDEFGAKGIASIISGGVSAVKNAINYLQGEVSPVTPLTGSTAIATTNLISNPNSALGISGVASAAAVASPKIPGAFGSIADNTPSVAGGAYGAIGSNVSIPSSVDDSGYVSEPPEPLPVGITQAEANELLIDPSTASQVVAAPNNPDNTIFNFVPGPGFNKNLS